MTIRARRNAVKRVAWMCDFIVALAFWPGTAHPQDLPSGEEVVARSIEAMGGKAAFEEVNTRITTGTLAFPSLGLSGTISIYQSRPDYIYIVTNLDEFGTIRRGYDGDTLWELNPRTGPRIYAGAEKTMLVFLNQFDRMDLVKHYDSVETATVDEVEGEKCYKVVATPKANVKPITMYISVESGLPVRVDYILETQRNDVVVENYYGDYLTVGKLLLPHSALQKMEGLETTYTYASIELNAEIAPGRYDLPDKIKELK